MFNKIEYDREYYRINRERYKIVRKKHNDKNKIERQKIYQQNKEKIKENNFVDNGLLPIFKGIIRRCNKKNCNTYKYYGARGIKCLWVSYKDFKNDMYESFLKHIEDFGKKQTTIDRIDVNGHYCKENCRWATYAEQGNNKRNNVTYNGLTAKEASKKLGGTDCLVSGRIFKGWSIDKAFTFPVRIKRKKL